MEFFYLSIRLLLVGVFFDSIHNLYYYNKYYSSTSGYFNLGIMLKKKSRRSNTSSKILNFLKPLIGDNFYILLLIRALLSFSIILFVSKLYFLIFLLFLLQLLFNIRSSLSLSGADQMRTIFLFGLSVMSIGRSYFFEIGLLFIIIQLNISYFFTGFNKIKSPVWTSGKALIWTMNSELFGNAWFQSFLIKRGILFNKIICWCVILFQLLFPFLSLNNYTVVLFLLIGFSFHLSLAIFSNLNDFFWTFISAYPLVYYLTNHNLF